MAAWSNTPIGSAMPVCLLPDCSGYPVSDNDPPVKNEGIIRQPFDRVLADTLGGVLPTCQEGGWGIAPVRSLGSPLPPCSKRAGVPLTPPPVS